MLKIAIFSLITLFLSVIIRQKSQEFSMIINVVGGLSILILCFDKVTEVIDYYSSLSSSVNIDSEIIKVALKIICIGFLTEFVADLASDFGNSSIASKVVFGGKVIICVITLPIIKELVSLLFSFY